MRTRNRICRMASSFGLLLSAATISSAARPMQNNGRHFDTIEKANSVPAAMSPTCEGVSQLSESVSKSIARVERTGTLNVIGIIVQDQGRLLIGDGFGSDDSSTWGQKEMKVHLSDGQTVITSAAGWSQDGGLPQ